MDREHRKELDKDPALKAAEQAEREEDEGHEVDEEKQGRFFEVAAQMRESLRENSPEKVSAESGLSPKEVEALRLIYQANTARGESGEYLSGRVRNQQLNQALATLQPVLAAARSGEFSAAQELTKELAQEIKDVRYEIKQQTIQQAGKLLTLKLEKKPAKEDGDDDEKDDDDETDDELGG